MQKKVAAEFKEVMAQLPSNHFSFSILNANWRKKNVHKTLHKVAFAAIPIPKTKLPFLIFPTRCRPPQRSEPAGIGPANQRSLTQLRVVSGNLKTGRPFADSALIGARCEQAVRTADGAAAASLPPLAPSCPELPAAPKREVMSPTGTLREAAKIFQAKHLRNNGSNPVISVQKRRGKGRCTPQVQFCHF